MFVVVDWGTSNVYAFRTQDGAENYLEGRNLLDFEGEWALSAPHVEEGLCCTIHECAVQS